MILSSEMTSSESKAFHSVMVNGGSGVLVSAMSKEYSYVLTANHVVAHEGTNSLVEDYAGKKLRVLDIIVHSDAQHRTKFDCAIVIVEYIEKINQYAFPAALLPTRANLSIAGFPKTERASADPWKLHDGHMTSVVDDLIIFSIDGIPGKNTISGMSGGGVYYDAEEGRPYLVGVECRMDGQLQEQQYGRVQCRSLNIYEQIIQANGKVPMIPAHLECFSRLKDLIFEFNVVKQEHVGALRTELLKFADTLVAGGMPAPYQLMEKYNTDLLINPIKSSEVGNKELWVGYFEFLIISAIIDNVALVDSKYIHGLEKKRRVLYSSDGTNWIGQLELILKSARRFLDTNGTVVIVSPEPAAEMLPNDIFIDNIVSNIALVPNSGPLAPIDKAESSLYKSFVLRHLEGLRKQCVVLRELQFAETKAGIEQLRTFRKIFNEFIK